jgi:hypothetical protein
MFGVAPSTISRLFIKGCHSLHLALNNLREAAIRWPTIEEQHDMATMVEEKEPLMWGRWGFVDGKNYRVQESGNSSIQNSQYNGWLHYVFVTGIDGFTALGVECYAKLNYFGSWKNWRIHTKVLVSDTASPVSNEMLGKILTPLKEGDIEKAPPYLRDILSSISAACTSIRKSAEWGMGAVAKIYRV